MLASQLFYDEDLVKTQSIKNFAHLHLHHTNGGFVIHAEGRVRVVHYGEMVVAHVLSCCVLLDEVP